MSIPLRSVSVLALVACLTSSWPSPATAGPVISEFMADNASGLIDEDGDHSDWIEITNPESEPADLGGWRLTDNPDNRSKWKFPTGVQIAPGGHLIVFASGKDRRNPGGPFHTSFSLRREGEYLALYPPSGSTAATAFHPQYPAQYPDVSYGTGLRESALPLIPSGAPARISIPAPADPDRHWTGAPADEPFFDSDWLAGTTRSGYDDLSTDSGQSLLGYWSFDDLQRPRVALDSSGHNHHGTLVGPAAFTASRGGHSGTEGDHALNLGPGNNQASVRVDAASQGGFDLMQSRDQVTVSLWAFGGPQMPAVNCAFWFDSGATTGDSRNIMAHLPWSDGVIYFDTAGCCAGDTRISREETDTSHWRGRWNHYVFLKDGPRKEIWQNGVLWHSGSGAIPLKEIKSLWLGSANDGGASYPGQLDDIAVWAGALSPADILSLSAGISPLSIGSYRPLITTDLASEMQGVSTRARLRIPFNIPADLTPDVLLLKVHYDDGFVAWLNGTEVARQNVPVTARRTKAEGLRPVVLNLANAGLMLQPGTNILALEGMNDDLFGSDFLLSVELSAGARLPGRYFPVPTPGTPNGPGVAALTAGTTVSPGRGFYESPVTVTLSCPTPDAQIRYTLDGSLPTVAHGNIAEPIEIHGTPSITLTVASNQVIQAFAVHDDYEPSKVETHTYLFAQQVEKQPAQIPGYPATWGVYGAYGPRPGQPVPADYEMDPRITRTTTAGFSVLEAILSLPALCISTDIAHLFDPITGIYPNSASQGTQWVRPASAELIFPGGEEGFQTDAGLRIHGGLSRQHWHARKHSFRLNFQREFGPARLHYRLFDDSRVTSFNELTLRASSTDGWSVEDTEPWLRTKATYLRDPWMKDTQQALGWPCGHSRYVHLFLNGLYWGQYNLAERTEAAWLAENFGGTPEEYDIIKDVGEVESGDKVIWDRMMALAESGLDSDAAYWKIQGRRPDGSRDLELPVYLDINSLIDFMILHIYSGGIDWPNHNWWSARRRGEASHGFRFFTWDQEISNLSLTATITYTGEAFESVSGPRDSPAFLYAKLRKNSQFRARFSARVIALTTGFGILTPLQNAARWERRQSEIDQSIVAESARWGDSRQSAPLKRSDWLREMNWMRSTYWPRIHEIAISRFRSAGLYSAIPVPAVVISPPGGIVSATTRITLSGGPNIFFSTNGLDPLTSQGMPTAGAMSYTTPLTLTGPTHLRAQRAIGSASSTVAAAFFLTMIDVAPASKLVVSEVHYHPSDLEEEEFVEVKNGSATQNALLGGGRLSGGIDFIFPNAWVLPPGKSAVAVRNRQAFEARYGTGWPVAGEFSGVLANEGEWIHLLAPSGQLLSRFYYHDSPPWPALADGGGRSLTLVRSREPVDPTDPHHWRPSVTVGGTPGWDEGLAFVGDPVADEDADGLIAVEEYYLGTNDRDAHSGPGQAATISLGAQGQVQFTLQHRLEADQADVSWETSTDLEYWEPASGWPEPDRSVSGGTETLLWRTVSAEISPQFYRLRFQLR